MTEASKPVQNEHFEDVDLKHQEETLQEHDEIDINDVQENKRLNRRLDLRVLPLCCWVYLLNFLDRGMLPSPLPHQDLIANTPRQHWQCPSAQRRDRRRHAPENRPYASWLRTDSDAVLRRLCRLRDPQQLGHETLHPPIHVARHPALRMGSADNWIRGRAKHRHHHRAPIPNRRIRSWVLPRSVAHSTSYEHTS